MFCRAGMAALMICAATSAAPAQRAPQLPFPAEKFSTRPVQPRQIANPSAQAPPATENTQKQRWQERSRIPSGP